MQLVEILDTATTMAAQRREWAYRSNTRCVRQCAQSAGDSLITKREGHRNDQLVQSISNHSSMSEWWHPLLLCWSMLPIIVRRKSDRKLNEIL